MRHDHRHRARMLAGLIALLVALSAATAGAIEESEVTNPRKQKEWVADMAHVLTPTAEAGFNDLLRSLYQDLRVEGVVVTVKRVDGEPDDFARRLFYRWVLGRTTNGDAFIVLLVVRQRGLAVFAGPDLQDVLPKDWLADLQLQKMVPEFRRKKYHTGIQNALDAIDRRLRSNWDEVARGETFVAKEQGIVEEEQDGSGNWAWICFAIGLTNLVLIGVFAFFFLKRKGNDEGPPDDEGQPPSQSGGPPTSGSRPPASTYPSGPGSHPSHGSGSGSGNRF